MSICFVVTGKAEVHRASRRDAEGYGGMGLECGDGPDQSCQQIPAQEKDVQGFDCKCFKNTLYNILKHYYKTFLARFIKLEVLFQYLNEQT